jgi:hypothetical protein
MRGDSTSRIASVDEEDSYKALTRQGICPNGCLAIYSGALCSPLPRLTLCNSKGTPFSCKTIAMCLVGPMVEPYSLIVIAIEENFLDNISEEGCWMRKEGQVGPVGCFQGEAYCSSYKRVHFIGIGRLLS